MAGARIIVLRPQPGATATAQALRANGHDPLVTPLFAIEPVAWTPADPQAYDALLVGSANVFRHGGPALADLKGLPVYAVGGKTARMASDLGFRVRGQGTGGLAAMLPMLVEDGHLHVLRLAGEDRVDLPASRLAIDTRIVYRSRALPMPDALREALTGPAIVLLHSARAAQHFGTLVDSAGIDRGHISLALFAPALVDAAGDGWASVRIAAAADDRALLDVVATLCQHEAGRQRAKKPETE
ncbi:uroporphyrinogen-III synthase [Sphingomonas ursincola]|uniref:Uroporphyrinogen-III synthase n=2 Tax=Sphingomonadaceae TaxID=41297 RepID=A0A7V8RGR5_9SPHN|nr:uroporphyrinogen-III synthase [Sphingomonas ursincola]MBA1376180.1 uroporphyrinogen-III synthase [Sphingomonas ursincola]